MIDTSFDFRTDTPENRDPDQASPTLRRYHRHLWSKRLPSGRDFHLSDTTAGYLRHRSDLGEFTLTSDALTATLKRARQVIDALPGGKQVPFASIYWTIGAYIVFPGNQVNRQRTINQARGLHPAIQDRIDLTLECIRRHYRDEAHPLASTLSNYADFFALFRDFPGYVDFFLLNDLVADDFSVRFFLPFDGFDSPALPADVGAYREFRHREIEFVEARNKRIDQRANASPSE